MKKTLCDFQIQINKMVVANQPDIVVIDKQDGGGGGGRCHNPK